MHKIYSASYAHKPAAGLCPTAAASFPIPPYCCCSCPAPGCLPALPCLGAWPSEKEPFPFPFLAVLFYAHHTCSRRRTKHDATATQRRVVQPDAALPCPALGRQGMERRKWTEENVLWEKEPTKKKEHKHRGLGAPQHVLTWLPGIVYSLCGPRRAFRQQQQRKKKRRLTSF